MSDDNSGPIHHQAVLTPDSVVRLPLWKFLALMGGVATCSLTVWQGYAAVNHRFDGLEAHMVVIDGKISQTDLAKIHDLIEEAVNEKLHKERPLARCPRHVVKGEAFAECPLVFPKNDDR